VGFIVIQCFNSDIHSNVLTLTRTKVTSNRVMDSCSGISERFCIHCNYKYISD